MEELTRNEELELIDEETTEETEEEKLSVGDAVVGGASLALIVVGAYTTGKTIYKKALKPIGKKIKTHVLTKTFFKKSKKNKDDNIIEGEFRVVEDKKDEEMVEDKNEE